MATKSEKIDFIKRAFGAITPPRDGINVAIRCPQCRHSNKRKLIIRIDDDRFHCWVCGIKGVLPFLLRKYSTPDLQNEFRTRFSSKYLAGLDEVEPEREKVTLPEGFRLLAPRLGSIDPAVRHAIRYLSSRGMTQHDLWYYKFGTVVTGHLSNRVLMPSFDAEGELNFYAARSLNPYATYGKYMNSEADKKAIIFNEINVDWEKELTLVEGPFDLVKCVGNATCLLGSELPEDSLLFYRIIEHKTPIILALDEDMRHGNIRDYNDRVRFFEAKIERIARLLDSYDIEVRVLPLFGHADVGEMTREDFKKAKSDARKWDAMHALLVSIDAISSRSLL